MKARQAIIYSFTSKYLVLTLQFGSTVILSRLLTPEDIGIYSIAFALIAFGHVFRDFGVTNYITQEKELTDDRIRAAMLLTLVFSWSISAILFSGADAAAGFYEEPGIKNVFQVLALSFVLIPFGSVTRAYISRQMQFRFLMVLQVIGTVVNVSVVIFLAFQGYRYMSMAWASLAGIFVEIIILLYFRPKELPYLPGVKEIKRIFSFGSASFSETMLTYFASYIPHLIIGKFLGMSAVGLLSRSEGTIRIFDRLVTEGISPVLLPYFSKENRESRTIKKPFLHTTMCVTGLAWPIFAFMGILADPLIYVLYGDQWGEVVIFLQIMCFQAALARLYSFVHPALMSQGRVQELLKLQIFFVPLHIGLVVFTVQYGLLYVLIALTLIPVLKIIVTYKLLHKYLLVQVSDYINLTLKCLWPALFSVIPILIIQYAWPLSPFFNLVLSAFFAVPAFIISIFLFKHPLAQELQMIYQKITEKYLKKGISH